jgi:hypothetical protein
MIPKIWAGKGLSVLIFFLAVGAHGSKLAHPGKNCPPEVFFFLVMNMWNNLNNIRTSREDSKSFKFKQTGFFMTLRQFCGRPSNVLKKDLVLSRTAQLVPKWSMRTSSQCSNFLFPIGISYPETSLNGF